MKNILFICVENSCRSQLAEAFAKMYGKGKINAHSAGSSPSGKINEIAITLMKKIGYDLTTHKSKSLIEVPQDGYDYAITMGCGDSCPRINAKHKIDWEIPDPKNLSLTEFKTVVNLIEEKVKFLIYGIY